MPTANASPGGVSAAWGAAEGHTLGEVLCATVVANEIAGRVGILASTLSFHVKALSQAGLIGARQRSRHIYYSANFDAMNALIAFLGENCCGGRPCAPARTPARRRRAA